ncbi:MAG: S-layer homology domain-containing protein [Oscillospiraceae bacterium]|nr:S-layer homology domain-containing protein [Oscillospiraceae bacterium]
MEKRVTSLLLVIAMIATLFSGMTLTASAEDVPAEAFVLAGSVKAGDKIMFVYPDDTPKAAGPIDGYTETQTYLKSVAAEYNDYAIVSAEALVFEVEDGTAEGAVAFKYNGKYLTCTNATSGSNYVFLNAEEKSAETDWFVSIDNDGVAKVSHPLSGSDATRYLMYNASSPRFSAYVSLQKDIAIYKLESSYVEDSPEDIDVYFVDGTNTETPFVFCYDDIDGNGPSATAEDLAYPGDPQIEAVGLEMNGYPYYKLTLNPESVDTVMFGNGEGQFSLTAAAGHTAPLSYMTDAVEPPAELGGNNFVVYSVKLEGGVLVASKVDDVWPEPRQVLSVPTCTEDGVSAYIGLRTGAQAGVETTPALGHDWDEGTVTVEPTYQFPGQKTATCTRCGVTDTVEVPRLANPFEDVFDEDFFFNPVMWALDESVTGGVDPTHFMPARTVLRSDAVVFFWAANDRPEVEVENNPFKDVSDKHWAHKAVMWAVKNGITGGTKPDQFSPSKTCSRSEILQFLYAAMGKPEYTIDNPYSDINTNHWYYAGAIWAFEKGLEKGEGGMFNAQTPCTRAFVVTYLYRFFTGNELDE